VEGLEVALVEPFTIATGVISAARNVLVKVKLSDGTVGIGEASPCGPSGGETMETTVAAVRGMVELVQGRDARDWRTIAKRLHGDFEHQEAARAVVEFAVLDALTRHWKIPLYVFFGAANDRIETDITIPISEPAHMAELARKYAERGASTIKVKVGKDRDEDVNRVVAIAAAAPRCGLIVDGNQGYSPSIAVDFARLLHARNIRPILFEQPVHRHDLDGMRFVTERCGFPVAADEALHTAADALRIVRMGAANVLNVKLMKSGVAEALDIAAIARAAHVDLMIGCMSESRLGIAMSVHLAAGVGGFRYIDLDAPMFLTQDPFTGGYEQDGYWYSLGKVTQGLGVEPRTR